MTYPFTGFGGVRVDAQRSGERTYDLNTDGVAHYGMYVDWIEDLVRTGGAELAADMERGPEAYLQAWERVRGIEGRSCRTTAAIDDGLVKGMTPQQVLDVAGQPHARAGREFHYCVNGSAELLTAEFDPANRLIRINGRAIGSGASPAGTPAAPATGALPATGAPGLLTLVAACAALAGLALRRRRTHLA